MNQQHLLTHPWVVAKINENFYGFPIASVKELLTSQKTTAVPGAPAAVRGIINLRGQICRLVDTRLLFEHESLLDVTDQTIQMLHSRENDHRKWMQELQSSVTEQRRFTGQLDPHRCAFGIWYDSFRSENAFLNRVLVQFDEPHKKIHAIGHQVNQLISEERFAEAAAVIEKTQTTHLNRLFDLFDEARRTIIEYQREVMLVIEMGKSSAAFTVDSAESVEYLDAVEVNTEDWGYGNPDQSFILSTARRRGSSDLVMLLNPRVLLNCVDQKALETKNSQNFDVLAAADLETAGVEPASEKPAPHVLQA